MTTGSKKILIDRLPVGYRFNPSDEELVHCLSRKLLNIEEEFCIIPEFDIYKLPPWDLISEFNKLSDLASDGGECMFYYCRGDLNGKRNNRKTKDGFWKVTGEGRKPQESDQIKWLKKILVYHIGKQNSADKTDWAMHEYQIISNRSIVVCRIHKIKPKKVKEKVNSGSSGTCSKGSSGATVSSETQNETSEISPKMSVNKTTESEILTVTPNINVPQCSLSSPKQIQVVAEERHSLVEDTHIDSTLLVYLTNALADGCGIEDFSCSYPYSVTPEENGTMFIFDHIPIDQSSNYVLRGLVYPSQHLQMMPTGEISPVIDSGNEMDIHGQGDQLSIVSQKNGIKETNFEEAPQPILNSQTPVPPPNSFLLSHEQMLQGLYSTCGTHTSSDSSGGGSANAQQKNLQVTQDFAVGSPLAATQYSSVSSFLASTTESTVNNQAPIQTPNSCIPSPEEMQKPQGLSSTFSSMHPSSDSSGGGSANAFHLGQSYVSQQKNEVTRDFAVESQLAAIKHSYTNSSLASPPLSSLNFQTPVQTPNSYILAPEEMQKLLASSSTCSMCPSSNSSGRGIVNAFHLGQSYESQQKNLEVTQDFAADSLAAEQCFDSNSFLASPSLSTLNLETPIQPQNSYKLSPEVMQKPQGSSSTCCMHPSSDRSGGGIISTFQFDPSFESQQTMVTQDFATESLGAKQYSNIDSLLASPPQSTLNIQTKIQTPNSCTLSPEVMQKLQGLSSTYNMHASSDGSDGGSANAFHLVQSCESQQTNLEVTQDFATESLAEKLYSDISLSFASPPLSTLNFQTPIQPPNSYVLSPEAMQNLQVLSSTCSMQPSSDSSGRMSANAFHFGQSYESQQTSSEATQDFATESIVIEGSLQGSSIATGGYGSSVPYALEGTLQKSNPIISTVY